MIRSRLRRGLFLFVVIGVWRCLGNKVSYRPTLFYFLKNIFLGLGILRNISIMNSESFFSINGRLRRKDYLIRAILLYIPAVIVNMIIESSNNGSVAAFVIPIVLASSILTVIQAIKRLHDIDMSGWYWLLFLIPLVNLIFGFYVFIIKDGTVGPNRFGEDPKSRTTL